LFVGGHEAVTGTGGGVNVDVELTEGPPGGGDSAPVLPEPPPPPDQPVPDSTPEVQQDVVPTDEMIMPDPNAELPPPTPPTEAPKPHPINTNLYASTGGTVHRTGTVGGGVPGPGTGRGRGGSGGAAWGDPRYGNNPPPIYPLEARRMGQQGTVILSVRLNAEGTVETLAVKESSGYVLLDQAAMRAVKHWQFQAGTIGGISVGWPVEVPIEFRLDE
jgi:protein TonB